MAATRTSKFRSFSPLVLVAILLSAWVQRRILSSYFGSDDLLHLEHVLGLRPTPELPWRFLTQVVYFRSMPALFGLDPRPYFLVTYILHLLNTVFVFILSRRLQLPNPVSCLAAAVFGCFPLTSAALAHVVNINDVAALFFTFLTLHLV
jgi:hypothetical protein